jgi:hypothetical protein
MDTRFPTSDIDEIGVTDGLIAYYNMDNLDGTTLLDNSGNGNNATNVGATIVAGKSGNALSLNGTSNYVVINTSSITLTDFTISFWVYMNSFATLQYFINFNLNGSIGSNPIMYFNPTDGFGYYEGTNNYFFSQTQLQLNNWYYLTAVRTPTLVKLYVNGNKELDLIQSKSTINFTQFSLSYINKFNGLIDEVRIYNKSLTAAEILQLYKLNATKSTLLTDNYESSLNYSQTISLTTNIEGNNLKNDVTGENIGIISGATLNNDYFNFDGVDDYINIGDNARLNTGGTISCWYYARSSGEGSYGRIIDKSIDLNSTNGYFVYLYNGTKISVGLNATDAIIQSPSFPSLNVWHHLAVVIASTKKEIWIDGIKVANNTNTTLPPDIAGNVYIGNRADATDRTFDGYIKNMRIYTRSLDAEEIKYLYNKGK